MRIATITGALAVLLALAGCGPSSPEEVRAASIAKCERQFGRMAPDPSKGNALCTCLTDGLIEKGLEITDMFGENRSSVEGTLRSCAARVGIKMPSYRSLEPYLR